MPFILAIDKAECLHIIVIGYSIALLPKVPVWQKRITSFLESCIQLLYMESSYLLEGGMTYIKI